MRKKRKKGRKYCPKCGAELNRDDDYCTACGYSFVKRKKQKFNLKGIIIAIIIFLILWIIIRILTNQERIPTFITDMIKP